jgi:hypothetical protein
VRSEVLTVVTMKTNVFWNVMSSKLADSYEFLGKTSSLHLQSRRGIFCTEDEGNRCPLNVCNYIPDYMAPLFNYCISAYIVKKANTL